MKFHILAEDKLSTITLDVADKMLSLNKKLQEIGDKNTLEKQKIEEDRRNNKD